jgi:hypothetical protein
MMVAEFVARQHSGSPVNGETPNQNHTNSNMPGHSALLLSNSGNMSGGGGGPGSFANNNANISMMNGNSNGSNGSMNGLDHQMLDDRSSPTSSCGQYDENGAPYDLAAHLKRKELFSQRKQREFIPDNKKDDSYWDRRRRNNEAAKRSREKRRFNDMVLEQRVVELTKENHVLKAQLDAIKDKYNICGENLVSVDQILATLPTSEQVLSITKRAKISTPNGSNAMNYPSNDSPSPSPMPTSVIHQNVTAVAASASLSSGQNQSPSPPNALHNGHNGSNGPMSHSHNYRRHTQSPVGGHNDISNDGSENGATTPTATILHNFHPHSHHHQQHSASNAGSHMNHNGSFNGTHPHNHHSNANGSTVSAVVHLANRHSPPNHPTNHAHHFMSGTGTMTIYSHNNTHPPLTINLHPHSIHHRHRQCSMLAAMGWCRQVQVPQLY